MEKFISTGNIVHVGLVNKAGELCIRPPVIAHPRKLVAIFYRSTKNPILLPKLSLGEFNYDRYRYTDSNASEQISMESKTNPITDGFCRSAFHSDHFVPPRAES